MKLIKHSKDIVKVIMGILVSSIMKLNKDNKDVWLISERKEEAEDNGYHMYKYIKENHPSQKVFYLINKQSESYTKLKAYDTVIQYNSLKHYIYYFLATKHLSAFQFFGVPETPIIWRMEEYGLIKNKKIFLQHGITKEMLPFLLYENTKYDLFVCGGKLEYDYVKDNYGYPEDSVKYLGFCRFDNLHESITEKQILLMPTWRHWFGMTTVSNDNEKNETNAFMESEYYKVYMSLINSDKLYELLNYYDIELIFYPHPEMQRFLHEFKCENQKVKIASRESCNLQELLKESKIIITDYSSIAFDCAYMRKPLLYYQFDQDRYYSEHFEKGYFDCERDGFGPVINDEETLINKIELMLKDDYEKLVYEQRSEKFFPLYDNQNCKRHYEIISEM